MPGLNSVWETINVITYIQSEIKGLIGCWLRTLWRDVQTQSSGSQSSQASCPTRQKTFSPSRTVDNVDNSASHFNVKIQGRPLISRKRVVWMAVWCGDRDGPHWVSEAASQPGALLSRQHCYTSMSPVRDMDPPEVPACPLPVSAVLHLPVSQPISFLCVLCFLLEILRRLKFTLVFFF